MVITLYIGLANFLCERPHSNLGFADYAVSVAAPQLWPCSIKASIDSI